MAAKSLRSKLAPHGRTEHQTVMKRLLARLTVAVSFGLFLSVNVVASDVMQRIDPGSYTPLFKSASGNNSVLVDAFLIDRYPVSNVEYYKFTRQHLRWAKSDIKPIFADVNYLKHLDVETLSAVANQPVTNVSWFTARAYCKAQDKRLPTTAEWEYAAQASESAIDGSRDPSFRQRILDWYARPASEALPNVSDTPENYWGVHGMHGVVWELVDDFNTALVTGESRGDSQLEKSLFCGAGAASSVDPSDYAAFMRYALRSSYKANYTMTSLGFRCARDLAPEGTVRAGENHEENS